WYETSGFNIALLLVCVLLFLSAIPVLAIAIARNRRHRADHTATPRSARLAQATILAICLLNLLFLVSMALWLMNIVGPRFGISTTYQIVLGMGVLSAILTAVALLYTVRAWQHKYW